MNNKRFLLLFLKVSLGTCVSGYCLFLFGFSTPQATIPSQICFEFDRSDCNGNFSDAQLKLTEINLEAKYNSETGQLIDYKESIGEIKSASITSKTTKVISGNKYDTGKKFENTYEELWAWAHGGVKPTSQQLESMTDQQAWDWFRDRYKYRNGNFLNHWWEYPSNIVQTTKTPGYPICFDAPLGNGLIKGKYLPIKGKVRFANGSECETELIPASNRSPVNGIYPMNYVKIKKPCSSCN